MSEFALDYVAFRQSSPGRRRGANDQSPRVPLKDSDGRLTAGPLSVVTKNATGPSGDKHDYVSQMSYFWPLSNSSDGCPYVVRDGEYNPEAKRWTDQDGLKKVFDSSNALSLAWHYTGQEAYARNASLVLQTGFVDEATRMNPSMDFGAVLPCVEPSENP
ncbi:hypothetical protein ACHAQH_007891 [Verticillium albo-atrum]